MMLGLKLSFWLSSFAILLGGTVFERQHTLVFVTLTHYDAQFPMVITRPFDGSVMKYPWAITINSKNVVYFILFPVFEVDMLCHFWSENL